jgi:hypothetical protein
MGMVVIEGKCLERPFVPLPKHRDGWLLSQIGCVVLMALPVIAVGLFVLFYGWMWGSQAG